MVLALFDLDNTLLNGDSDHSWGVYLTEIGVVDKQVHQQAQDHFYQQYVAGNLDINEFLDFQLSALNENSLENLIKWRSDFIETIIKPMIAQDKVELVKQHQAAGDKLIIITATNDFIARPIADLIGVETLIATQTERTADGYTGNVVGIPCFQNGKITLLNEWLNQNWTANNTPFKGSWFYSDSYNDLPLLQLVDHPIAVTPDDRLRVHAQESRWKIID